MEGGSRIPHLETTAGCVLMPFVDNSQGGWTGLFRELSHHFQPFAAGSVGRNGAFVDRPRPQSRCLRLVSSEDCTGEAADPVPPLLDQKATLRALFLTSGVLIKNGRRKLQIHDQGRWGSLHNLWLV